MVYVRAFYNLFEISIKSSFLILAILIIKKIFWKKIGAKNQYSLWFLLIIRLVLPSVPDSNFSFFNVFTKIKSNPILKKHYYIYEKKEIIGWFNTPADLIGSNKPVFSLQSIIPMIWILGMMALTVHMIVSNVRFKHIIENSKTVAGEEIQKVLEEYKKKININKPLKIYKSTFIDSPCLYGLLKPCILIPEDMEEKIDRNELKYVISHELAHFKRKDILLYLIMYLLQIIYWFNPVIWYGFSRMRNDCEAACDALALSLFEKDERENYGFSIIHLLERSKTSLDSVLTTEFVNTKQHLKRRIKMIKSFKKNSYKVSFITIFVFLLIGGLFLTNANSQPYESKEAPEQNIEQITLNINDGNVTEGKISYKEMIWPVPSSKKISSNFGKKKHPVNDKEVMHTGINISAKLGESIVASADGKIIYSDTKGGYGKVVIIDHGDGFATMYAHCSELLVHKDEQVSSGTQIAKVGSTGGTEPHLHFEIRKDGEAVDPANYFE